MKIPESVMEVIGAVEGAGGTAMVVGGSVVDSLMGTTPKDWDIEVYGFSVDQLLEAMQPFKPNEVGKSFGILKLSSDTVGGLDVDVSVPRTENRVGVGHKDFKVEFPNLTPKEAARRRDFTINSLFFNPETGEVVDYYGGLKDLEDGVLRATDPETFVEDPLRCLRAMQLLARKAKTVDDKTAVLCAGMVDQLKDLSAERLYEEWCKLLMKAPVPSRGLWFLEAIDGLRMFPELDDLLGCPQNPDWHPEGDVWNHTLKVVDAAAIVRDSGMLPKDWKVGFLFGALLHDVGKPEATDDELKAHGHNKAGEPLAESFMRRLTRDKELIHQVVSLTRQHMQPVLLTHGEAKTPAWRRLHNKLRLDVLGWLSRCDSIGSQVELPLSHVLQMGDHDPSRLCWQHFEEFGEKPIPHLLQGRDLIKAGLKPGPHFGDRLKAAYEAQLNGEEDLDMLLEIAKNLPL